MDLASPTNAVGAWFKQLTRYRGGHAYYWWPSSFFFLLIDTTQDYPTVPVTYCATQIKIGPCQGQIFFILFFWGHLTCLKNIGTLRLKLVPYFGITHALHGQLLGPYNKLPESHRRLVLDLVATIGCNGNDGLCTAVRRAVATTGEQNYWEQLEADSCTSLAV
jgi:hypothetical protein